MKWRRNLGKLSELRDDVRATEQEIEAKRRLAIAIQGLNDVCDPVSKFEREIPDGYSVLDGQRCVRLLDTPQTYKDIAREALREIGREHGN